MFKRAPESRSRGHGGGRAAGDTRQVGTLLAMLAILMVALLASACPAVPPSVIPPGCCRICRVGKPCGDTCISRYLTCTRPPGCACWGAWPTPPHAGLTGSCYPAL